MVGMCVAREVGRIWEGEGPMRGKNLGGEEDLSGGRGNYNQNTLYYKNLVSIKNTPSNKQNINKQSKTPFSSCKYEHIRQSP